MTLHPNPQSRATPVFDVVLVGAGLASGILALRLAALPERLHILILEASDRPFGDKTWSFQRTDVTPAQAVWLDPAVIAEWPSQSVRFADLNRELATPYASIHSASLGRALERRAG